MRVTRDKSILPILGANVKDLRTKAGLTTEGLTFALKISRTSLIMLEKGGANISPKIARKIALFFGIKIDALYSEEKIELNKDIRTIKSFYKKNKDNPRLFIQRRSEYKVAAFLKTVLAQDPFLLTKRNLKEIRQHCSNQYKKEFDVYELSREIRRMCLKNIINRESKGEARLGYLYWANSN